MAVLCSVTIKGDYAVVLPQGSIERGLRFDISKSGCRMYENTRQQSKDFFDEIVRWCGERPGNADVISRSIQMFLSARRRELGLLA